MLRLITQLASSTISASIGVVAAAALEHLGPARWPGDYMFDFNVFRRAADDAHSGRDFYGEYRDMRYTHPPINVVVYHPFARLRADLAQCAWTALSVLIGTHSSPWPSARNRLGGLLRLSLLDPVRKDLLLGQINMVAVEAIRASQGSRDVRLRGLGTGAAASIKLTPLLFIPHSLVMGQWRTAVNQTGAFVGLNLLGLYVYPKESAEYWSFKAYDDARAGDARDPRNQSLLGASLRFLSPGTAEKARRLWPVSTGVLTLATLAMLRRCRHTPWDTQTTIVGLATCVASPISWNHHYVWAAPALQELWSARGVQMYWWERTLTFAMNAVFCIAPYRKLATESPVSQHYSVAQAALGASYPVAATGLIFMLLRVANRRNRARI